MKYSLLFIFIFISDVSFSQSIKFHGTEIIAAIGLDGVIICTDTRVNITDENNFPLAYFDGVSKIQKIGNYGIAIVGISHSDRVNLLKLMDAFGKTDLSNIDVSQIPYKWYEFIDANLLVRDTKYFSNNGYILVGYNKDKPFIIRFSKSPSNKIFYQQANHFSVDKLADSIFNYKADYSCTKLLKMAKKAIYKYAIISKRESDIGGPISSLIIKPTGEFVPNKYCDFKILPNEGLVKEVKRKKIKFHYLTPQAKRDLDSTYNLN